MKPSTPEIVLATSRVKRVDAQKNVQAVLDAAAEVFAISGVDAPVREIAGKAGVGIATIYRHFPSRSDLVASLFRSEVDACCVAGSELGLQHAPGKALDLWIRRYVDFIVARRGLAAALSSGDPAFNGLPDYFLQSLRPVVQDLLDRAAAEDAIRQGVEADDVLYAVAGLCTPPVCSTSPDAWRLVSLFMDGLRFRANSAGSASTD